MEREELMNAMFKEIELIQEVIKRMAFNSFLLKGWTVTLVAVTLLIKGNDKYKIAVAFIPLLIFWFLDAYFLWQERMYRKLYEWVIANRFQTDKHLFELNAYRFQSQVQSKIRIMFSLTLGWFYGSILLMVVAYSIMLP